MLSVSLKIYPPAYHELVGYKYNDYCIVLVSVIPALMVHEIGHYIFGELSGGKGILNSKFVILIKAHFIRYNKYQKISFGFGGPATNLAVGIILLFLSDIAEIHNIIIGIFSYVNIVIGAGALLPVSGNRGGLKYLMEFIEYD